MCIIAHGLRKNFPEDEFKECLKTNPAGFFLAAIRAHDGTRTVAEAVRTLDENEAIRKFEELQPEDEIVLHARIPSRGDKNIENVHGWKSEEGVYFCHNGTMSSIKTWDDHTDSETFFRKFFLPCWRGEGRQFTENVEFLIQQFIGYSKFCFILPDGTVKLYGEYQKDHDMDYSNGSYKVYVRPAAQTTVGNVGGFRRDWDEGSTWWDNDDDSDDLYGYYSRANDLRRGATVSAPWISGGTREIAAGKKPEPKARPKAEAFKVSKPKTKGRTKAGDEMDSLFAAAWSMTGDRDALDVTPADVAKVLRGFIDHYVVVNYLNNFDVISDAVDGKPMDTDVRDAAKLYIEGFLDGTWLDNDFATQADVLAVLLAEFCERCGKGQSLVESAAKLLRDYAEWLAEQFPRYGIDTRMDELRASIQAMERVLGIGVGIETGYLSGTSVRPCAARYNRKAAWARTEPVRAELMLAPADAKSEEVRVINAMLNKLGGLIADLEKERK